MTEDIMPVPDCLAGMIQLIPGCRYSTGQGVSGSDARFQMYYETQCQNPVWLCLTIELEGSCL